ncbi:MAG: class II fructose-bisphosphate aldolase, partial [Planctomycetes bacterium]|nr:class II fructose-bisphosphate aldolase [Planctomycetota bacterium]
MSLISMKEMLAAAYKGGYAVGGFDGFNAETLQSIIRVGKEKRSPLLAICAPSEHAVLGAAATVRVAAALADHPGVDLGRPRGHARPRAAFSE